MSALAKKKVVRHRVDLIAKVFEEDFEISEGYRMTIKDVQEWGKLRPKLIVYE